jgi:hypothetical protein
MTNYINVNCCGWNHYYEITESRSQSRGYMKNGLYYSVYNEFINNKLILTKQEIDDYNEKNDYHRHYCSEDEYDDEKNFGSLFYDADDY